MKLMNNAIANETIALFINFIPKLFLRFPLSFGQTAALFRPIRTFPQFFRVIFDKEKNNLRVSLPLARHGRSCSWACLRTRLCWAARSVSMYRHSWMLALGLRLDLPVSGGLVGNDHHARGLEDGVFRHPPLP